MATVNKKFSVKNGLAVDGNVSASNITSFIVDGPSSASLTFTLSNVTSATINGSNIATESYVTELGYLTEETDPVFVASDVYGVTSTDISNWDTAYGWGDHSGAGYLTTETDPVFTSSDAAGITSTDISNWDTAYGWGDHSGAGYLTSAVESISSGDSNLVFNASSGTVSVNLAANVTVSQDLTVTGNLTVNGNTTTLNTETLAVEDNVVLLNKNVTGTPALDAGIEVERGDYTNAKIYWNETENAWYLSTPGDSSGAATEASIATGGSTNLFNTISDGSNTATPDSSTDTLTFSGSGAVTVVVDGGTDTVTIGTNAAATIAVGSVTLPDALFASKTETSSGTSQDLDVMDTSLYSSAKYLIQAKNGSGDIEVTEILVAVDGSSNAYITEYGNMFSNASLAEYTVTAGGGSATLSATSTSSGVVFKIVKTYIEV